MTTIHFSYRISHASVREMIFETCKALWQELSKRVMVPPDEARWLQIADGFDAKWQFPNCIGAVDGKHVDIQAPPHSGSLYFNHLGSFSIVLMALVDADYRFIFVDIGDLGSNSDGGVFSHSAFGKAYINGQLHVPQGRPLPFMQPAYKVPFVIVGDEAFPSRCDLLRPYPGRKTFTLSAEKIEYNARLSRARRIVENGFGILAHRFRIHLRTMQLRPDNAVTVVQATTALHNFLTQPDENVEVLMKKLAPDPESAKKSIDGLVKMKNMRGNHPGKLALVIRQAFTNFFNCPAGSWPPAPP